MSQAFEWDPEKARLNVRKHGVSFEEATTVFHDPLALFKRDEEHSDTEDRWHVLGISARERVLVVVTLEPEEDIVRIISARKATRREVQDYVESQS